MGIEEGTWTNEGRRQTNATMDAWSNKAPQDKKWKNRRQPKWRKSKKNLGKEVNVVLACDAKIGAFYESLGRRVTEMEVGRRRRRRRSVRRKDGWTEWGMIWERSDREEVFELAIEANIVNNRPYIKVRLRRRRGRRRRCAIVGTKHYSHCLKMSSFALIRIYFK